MDKTIKKEVQLTKNAAEKFSEILKQEGKEGYSLRFGDRKGGCSGFKYVLDFSEKAEESDIVFQSEGIEIHVNEECYPRLQGSIIDYVENLEYSGFKVDNPNKKSSCGCGSSHSYSSEEES